MLWLEQAFLALELGWAGCNPTGWKRWSVVWGRAQCSRLTDGFGWPGMGCVVWHSMACKVNLWAWRVSVCSVLSCPVLGSVNETVLVVLHLAPAFASIVRGQGGEGINTTAKGSLAGSAHGAPPGL